MISSEVVRIVMGWTKRTARWFPVVAAMCVLAACSGDEPDGGLPPGVTEGSPTIGVGVPTPSPTATSPAPVAATCPNEEAVAGDPARQLGPTVQTDVDGDGGADEVRIAADPAGGEGCAAFVAVTTNTGVTAAEPVWEIGSEGGLTQPAIHGFANIDGQPGSEILVDEAAGASTQFVGAFMFTEDDLERVSVRGGIAGSATLDTGDLFPYGGSVGHLEAVDCADEGRVVVSAATPSPDGAEQGIYDVERRFYVFDGPVLERDDVVVEEVPIAQLQRFPEFASSPFGSC